MRVRVEVDNCIRVHEDQLGPAVVDQLKGDFQHKNPQREMLRRIGKPHWGEPKEIRTWGQETDDAGRAVLTLPRGGMARVRKRFESAGLAREVVDLRQRGSLDGENLPDHLLALYPYQETAVKIARARECGIVRAPTGAGKTSIGFALAARLKVATLIVVYNGGLFDQWVKRAQKELGLPESAVGVIRSGKRKLRPLTIAMQQTLNSSGVDEELQRYFGCVIADEVQRAAAKTLFDVVDRFPARYRIGISADQRRKDGKEFLTHDLFGEVICDIKREDLIESGHVLDVQVRVIQTDFRADWYGMPTAEDQEREVDTNLLLEGMMRDETRNQLILGAVMDEVETEQVLVMSHRREHCVDLDRRLVGMGVRTGFCIGSDDYRIEYRKTVAGLESGAVRVGIGTYQAVGQGIDLPTVAVGVCGTPIASNQQVFNQVRGRFCRVAKGKASARIYYLWDRNVFGKKHLQNLVRWNADVVVQHLGDWVPAKEFLKGI